MDGGALLFAPLTACLRRCFLVFKSRILRLSSDDECRRLFGSELCPQILCPCTIIQCRFFRGISDTIVVFLQGFCLILVCYCRVLAKPCMKSCRYPLWDCRCGLAATHATKLETKPAGIHTRFLTKNTESYKVQTKAYTGTDKHL